jgi:hypothetical protein
MLKSVYAYNVRVGGKQYPLLYQLMDFGSSTFNSPRNPLVDMAREFAFTMQQEFEETPKTYPIRNHAPPDLAAWLDTCPLDSVQQEKFERALPKITKPEWIDDRETEEYKQLFNYFKETGKKSSGEVK